MTNWVRVPLGSAIVFTILCLVGAALVQGGLLAMWAAALIGLVAAVLFFVPIRGRLIASQWPVVAARFLGRRRRPVRPALPAASSISVISGEAGVRWDGHTLVAAVEVAPELALTLESGGRSSTDSELPLPLVASMMSQYGLNVDIDIVSSGRHVPPGTAYRTVYSQTVGPRPLVGQRRTWLVLRLHDLDNLAAAVERGPARRGAPKALAAAAHRVVQHLGQEEIRARALSAEELEDLGELLLAPVGDSAVERWSTIVSGTSFITTYTGGPELLAEGQWDRWWSWRTEDALAVIRLRGGARQPATVAVVLRYVHEGKFEKPLPDTRLSLPTGQQGPLLAAGIPGGDRSMQMPLPAIPLTQVAEIAVPIGPSGQILGQYDDGTLVAAPLWDQSAHPRRWRIDAQLSTEVARQLVLRALVTGAVVALHTDDRSRWDGLVASVNDPQRLYYATAGARVCDVAVFDGQPVTTVPTRTVLRLLDGATEVGSADMTLVEVPGQLLEVTVGGGDPQLLWVIRSREEDRYLGLGETQAPPRRVVSTEPVLTRAPRRPAEVPPRPLAPAEPGRPAAGVPTRARRDIAGPQRVARGGAAQPPPQQDPLAGRRGYRLPPQDHPPRR
jgi:type VII secretion protein EccE